MATGAAAALVEHCGLGPVPLPFSGSLDSWVGMIEAHRTHYVLEKIVGRTSAGVARLLGLAIGES